MTPEQQIFWSSLKCDPQWFAHEQGTRLSKLSGKRLHQIVDELLLSMTSYLSTPDMCNVIKTWLSVYNLPLDPSKLGQGFDLVHQLTGHYVRDNAHLIKPVEKHV